MTDPRTCRHEHTEPVHAYLHHANPKVGDPVWLANEGKPVARICTDCLAQLPAAWGCPDCSWVEERALCDPVPRLLLGKPCAEHAGNEGLAGWVQTPSRWPAPTTTEINAGVFAEERA